MQTEGWADRQTDMTKQIVAIRNLANAPKNICAILQLVILNFTNIAAIKICDSRSVTAKYLMTVKHVLQCLSQLGNIFVGYLTTPSVT